jgi:methanogenic corrinoid protein MtbC1
MMNSANVLDRLVNLPVSKFTWMAMSMFSERSPASNDDLPKAFKGDPDECQTSILSIIEAQIIPRLLKAERVIGAKLTLVPASRAMPSKEEIHHFVSLCVSPDPLAAQIFVNKLLKEGLNTEHIFLELITPAARELGTQWDLDRMDFVDVTHGLVRLHAIAHEIGFAYRDGPVVQGDVKRVMIASAPGSKHLLGPTIVADFFRKEGWQVVIEISSSKKELVQAVENEWFDTVGLSVSIASQLTDLGDLVDQIKRCSRNPRLVVLLGGPIFTVQNFQASDFGASVICIDAKEAVSLALAFQPTD